MSAVKQHAGQASVEFSVVAVLAAVAALFMAQLVLAGWTLLTAGEAARAGARAAHLGAEPGPASDRAVPLIMGRPNVTEEGGRVLVELETPGVIPGLPRITVEAAAALDPSGAGA